MQDFSKKKIALAVGAALALTAVAAQAAAPAARATKPALVAITDTNTGYGSPNTDTEKRELLSATGTTNAVGWRVILDSGVTTAGIVGDIVLSGSGANAASLTFNDPVTLANNHVVVYTGTTATPIALDYAYITGAGGTDPTAAVFSAADSGLAALDIGFDPKNHDSALGLDSGSSRVRLNAGVLEFSTDRGVTWAAVKMDLSAAITGSEIYTEKDGVGGFTASPTDDPIAAATIASIGNSLAPTPIVKTTSAAVGTLINGFAIDTGTPIALTAANMVVKTRTTVMDEPTVLLRSTGGYFAPTGTTFPAAALGTPSTATTAGSVTTVTFAGLGAAATAADYVLPAGTPNADDAAIYASLNFNTGRSTGNVPFTVDGVNAAKATYTEVFNLSDGAASKLANNGGSAAGDAAAFPAPNNVEDGASPAVTGASYDAKNGKLYITFGETMTNVGRQGDNREIMENVLVGSNSLAALALNAGGLTPNFSFDASDSAGCNNGDAICDNQLVIENLGSVYQVGTLTGTLSVTSGISFAEPDDTAVYNPFKSTLDNAGNTTVNSIPLSGGLISDSGAVEAPTASGIAIGTHLTTADLANCSVQAISGTDPTKIGAIRVNCPQGIVVASGKSLAGNLKLSFWDVNASARNFEYFPTNNDITINAAGTVWTIDIPTELLYSKIDNAAGTLSYLAAGQSAKILVPADSADTTLITANTSNIDWPWDVISDTLYTQRVKGTLTGANYGDEIWAYVARWVDKRTDHLADTTRVASIVSGKVSVKDDKLATDVELYFDDLGWLNDTYHARIGDAKAGTMQVYIAVHRSNDTASGNTQNGWNQQSSNVTATLLQDANDARGYMYDKYSVYEATLDIKSGKISGGKVGGQLTIAQPMAEHVDPGLYFLDQQGNLTDDPTDWENGAEIQAGGAFDMLVGVDAKTAAQLDNANNAFVLYVVWTYDLATTSWIAKLVSSADDGATNYRPFNANLLKLKDATVSGAITDWGTLALSSFSKTEVVGGTQWQLLGYRNPDRAAAKPVDSARFVKSLVGIEGENGGNWGQGYPVSLWREDGGINDLNGYNPAAETDDLINNGDMALTMLDNASAVLVENARGDAVAGSFKWNPELPAVAFANDRDNLSNENAELWTMTKADAATRRVGKGWSLISVPSAWTTSIPAGVGMLISAGAVSVNGERVGQFTWVSGETAPKLTAGQPIFVYSAAGFTQ